MDRIDVKKLSEKLKEIVLDSVALVVVFIIGLIGAIMVWADGPSDFEIYVSIAMLLTPVILIISTIDMCILQYFALAFVLFGFPFGLFDFTASPSEVKSIGFFILCIAQLVSLICTRYLWSQLREVPTNIRRFASIFALFATIIGLVGCGLLMTNWFVTLTKANMFGQMSVQWSLFFIIFFINELVYFPRFSEVLLFLFVQVAYSSILQAVVYTQPNRIPGVTDESIAGLSLVFAAAIFAILVILARTVQGDNRQGSIMDVLKAIGQALQDNIKSPAFIINIVAVVISSTGAIFVTIYLSNSISSAADYLSAWLVWSIPVFNFVGLVLHPSIHFLTFGAVFMTLGSLVTNVSGTHWDGYYGYLALSVGSLLTLLSQHILFHKRDDAVNEIKDNKLRIALLLFSAVWVWLGCVMLWSQPVVLARELTLTLPAFLISLGVFEDALFGVRGARQTVVVAMGLLSFNLIGQAIPMSASPSLTGLIFIYVGGIFFIGLYSWKSFTKEEKTPQATEEETTRIV